jgi:SAM-dependent methyltransferase
MTPLYSAAVPSEALLYRDFYYPLNVLLHVLTREEGAISYLHYGIFERDDESIVIAQERSTQLLLERLPKPPARLLDVGIGLATMLSRLLKLGYNVLGITPDDKQIAMARARFGETLPIQQAAFETFEGGPFDAVLFQESSQYIPSEPLFARAKELTRRVIVFDEFATRPLDTPGALHALPEFLEAATRHGFEVTENVDVGPKAAPTIEYFMHRLNKHRQAITADLGVTSQQVDELIESGLRYRESYRQGVYTYRLMQFRR